MILKNGQSLRVNLSTAPDVTIGIDYADHSNTGAVDDVVLLVETTAGERTILSGPGASTQRQVRRITLVNEGLDTATIFFGQNDGTTTFKRSPDISLRAGEQVVYTDGAEAWTVYTSGGLPRGLDGQTVVLTDTVPIRKAGTAPEAQGQYYCYAKDSGSVGAWSPGTPGLAGRATDGTASGDAGCIPIPAVGIGQAKYLVSLAATATVAQAVLLWDILLVNTGIAVTTTTAQTLNTVTLPARDVNGSTDGLGVQAALLVTAATTNASAVTTITISYTNSDGTSGRTATIPSFPTTATIGTVVSFNLQARDVGIRSVQSITLGTSLAGGSVSLVLYRSLALQNVPLANTGAFLPANAGARLYNGVCLHPVQLATNTGAATVEALLATEVRE